MIFVSSNISRGSILEDSHFNMSVTCLLDNSRVSKLTNPYNFDFYIFINVVHYENPYF